MSYVNFVIIYFSIALSVIFISRISCKYAYYTLLIFERKHINLLSFKMFVGFRLERGNVMISCWRRPIEIDGKQKERERGENE